LGKVVNFPYETKQEIEKAIQEYKGLNMMELDIIAQKLLNLVGETNGRRVQKFSFISLRRPYILV
jgi:hypothetical protein